MRYILTAVFILFTSPSFAGHSDLLSQVRDELWNDGVKSDELEYLKIFAHFEEKEEELREEDKPLPEELSYPLNFF